VLFRFIIVPISLRLLWQPPSQRQKLVDAIENYDVLRFVGGYPLPPDLTSSTLSVRKAIERLGANVALASIRYDEFAANFVSESETEILAALDHALDNKHHGKRKASEITVMTDNGEKTIVA
jgi:hypothetical protein